MSQSVRKISDSASVTFSQPFAAIIQKGADGKKTLVIQSKMFYQHQLNKFKDDEKVTLEVHSRKLKRSEQQNRYYWGAYLPLIAAETGERDLDRLHELFKGKFLTTGIVEVLGEKVRMKGSTTKLSRSEFSDFIGRIEELTGIQSPPTEDWGLETLKT